MQPNSERQITQRVRRSFCEDEFCFAKATQNAIDNDNNVTTVAYDLND